MLFTVQDKLGGQGLIDNTSGCIFILVSKASADQMNYASMQIHNDPHLHLP